MTVLLLMTAVAALALLVRRQLRHGRTKPVRRGVVLSLVVAILGMQALIGTPAFAAPTDCAPNPERPDSGMVWSTTSTSNPAPSIPSTATSRSARRSDVSVRMVPATEDSSTTSWSPSVRNA